MSPLYRSIKIGNMLLKNRVVMPAMGSNFADESGQVTDRLIDYYKERALGGAALIIVEIAAVDVAGKRIARNLGVFNDSFLGGLSKLAKAVKDAGSKIALQLNHGGRECISRITGFPPVAPSSLPSPYSGIKREQKEIPKTLTLEEIAQLEDTFAMAARRAQQAGFDAVEIHGAHGYLVSQFISPLTNLRTDSYGGSVDNRARFFRNIIQRCKEKTDQGFPIIARLNAKDYMEGGLETQEAVQIAQILERAGADAIHVSVGMHGSNPYMMIPHMHVQRGCNIETTKEFKKVLCVPVICVGRINDPHLAEKIISESIADLVAMGRALIAEPYLPIKFQEKRKDYRQCLACCECINSIHKGKPLSCSINPDVGWEKENLQRIQHPAKYKRVWVVGGGPAGLEASRVAAMRGCRVTLWEESEKLGGQLNLAIVPPDRREIRNIISYYETILPVLKVEIKTGQKVTRELVVQGQPEAIILATGGLPSPLTIAGMKKKNQIFAWDVLQQKVKPGPKCAIIGAGAVGRGIAEFLGGRGHKVLLLDIFSWEELMETCPRAERLYHEMKFSEHGIKFYGPVNIERISDSEIIFRENGWRKSIMGVNTIIVAAGAKSRRELVEQLNDLPIKVALAGDCEEPGKIINAIHAGNRAAMEL